MKRLTFAVIASLSFGPAIAGDVNATIGFDQPGFYGQIHIGGYPRPPVIYAQPVWVERPAKVVYVEPVYLRVPPGHEKHWSKHCAQYHACGRPVYFVREDWYQKEYVPRHYSRDYDAHGNDRGGDRQDGNGQGHGHGHEGHGN